MFIVLITQTPNVQFAGEFFWVALVEAVTL